MPDPLTPQIDVFQVRVSAKREKDGWSWGMVRLERDACPLFWLSICNIWLRDRDLIVYSELIIGCEFFSSFKPIGSRVPSTLTFAKYCLFIFIGLHLIMIINTHIIICKNIVILLTCTFRSLLKNVPGLIFLFYTFPTVLSLLKVRRQTNSL